MQPTRKPHWRSNAKQSERAARTYRLAIFVRVFRSAVKVVESLRPVAPGVYQVAPAAVLELRHRLAEAMPHADADEVQP
jgi:hypothetical protein